jgi:hypothetical protein
MVSQNTKITIRMRNSLELVGNRRKSGRASVNAVMNKMPCKIPKKRISKDPSRDHAFPAGTAIAARAVSVE